MMCSSLVCVVTPSACDSGQDTTKNTKSIEATNADRDTKADAALADRKAKREAEAREAAAAKREQEAELDALAVIPESLPKSLDKACDAMLKSYDSFMQTTLEGDMLTKWKTGGNEMQLAVFRKECLKRDIATAACQAHALGQATPQLSPRLADIMQACADKAAAGASPSP